MSVKLPIYGLIGDGRLARHLAHYFFLLGIPCQRWSRRLHQAEGTNWQSSLKNCTTLLLAVSDGAIDQLAAEIRSHSDFKNTTLIHFSGALHSPHAWGFHPLMSFPNSLYSLEAYERIPFILDEIGDENAPTFSKVFPRLKNPSAKLSPDQKALYHAWCVMGGNFTAFLWTRMFEVFSDQLGLDPALATPYLRQVSENLLSKPQSARSTWTGPIVRKDFATIEKHLQALSGDAYEAIYQAFLKTYDSKPDRTKGSAT